MRPSSSLSFVVGLCAVGICAYLIGAHGPNWVRTARERLAPAPDYPHITALAGGPLVLISTSTCPWCAKARGWLQQRGWPYRDCVLDQLPTADRVLDAVGTSAVPQLITAHGRVIGYDVDAYATLTATAAARGSSNETDGSWRCAPAGQVAGRSPLE